MSSTIVFPEASLPECNATRPSASRPLFTEVSPSACAAQTINEELIAWYEGTCSRW
jgi:hypothetical protein